jgi:dihydrofolate synthase/folylpolyglutamate synthase
LDATNAVIPLVSVITPIALDHMRWLGKTVTEVAQEKAGIIKPSVPVVSAPQDPAAAEVIVRRAKELRCSLTFAESAWDGAELGLPGRHQRGNAALAITSLRAAGVHVSDEAIAEGLRNVRWPGRFQMIGERFVLDGCHNPHAAQQLLLNWTDHFGTEQADVIFGALADKDYSTMLEILAPISREVLLVPVRSERGAAPEILASACSRPHRIFANAKEALKAAQGKTLVTGSLFLVGEILELLGFES